MLRIAEHWHGSDLGRQRQGNEDNYFVRAPLFVVADGMGGAQAGEVASEIAAASFEDGLPSSSSAADGLVRIIEGANRQIHDRSRADADLAGMGTTVTAAYVGEDEVTIAHVGDSRAYVMRDGEVVRLTRDHSLVGELIARGKLTEEQAETHPQRSVITRALGPEPSVEVDVDTFQARHGDLFLICSDGLTSMIPESRIGPIISRASSLEEAGHELIDAANDAGGRDNITVVLFRLESVGEGAHASAVAGTLDDDTSEYATVTGEHGGTTTVMSAVRPRAEPEEHPPREREVPRGGPSRPDRPPRRRRRFPVGLAVLVTFLALVVAAFWTATRIVYFVGTDPQRGQAITIYQGLPYILPFGIRLYSRQSGSGVTLPEVPPARRSTFTDHKLRSLDDAENLVNALERGHLEP